MVSYTKFLCFVIAFQIGVPRNDVAVYVINPYDPTLPLIDIAELYAKEINDEH